ncbi:MAG TPA: hypothetical protein VM842_01635, partial [Nitrospira sp.]|nr:hypothetical protein [Nitrospira sp.]
MLRHWFIVAAMSLEGFHGTALALSPPNGSEKTTPSDLHQAHPGADPTKPADIGNTSIQALAAGAGGVVYAGSFGMGIFRSGDRGDTWTPANDGLTDPFVLCLTTA